MKKKIFGVSTPLVGAAAAWMGYNIFVKDYFPTIPDVAPAPNKWTAWNIIKFIEEVMTGQKAPLTSKIKLLAEVGITGKFPTTLSPEWGLPPGTTIGVPPPGGLNP